MSATKQPHDLLLDGLVESISRTAIDSHIVKENLWVGSHGTGYSSPSWQPDLPIVSGPTGKRRFKQFIGAGMGVGGNVLPGMVHVGEGRDGEAATGTSYLLYEFDPWNDLYKPWIDRIEQAFDGWRDIPNPSDFDIPNRKVRSAITSLTPIPVDSTNPGGETDNPDLAAAIDTLADFLSDGSSGSESEVTSQFSYYYGAGRIEPVMRGQSQIAIALGMVLTGEKELWASARRDVVAIARAARSAMKLQSAEPIKLSSAIALLDLVGKFLPPGLSQVAAVASSAAKLAAELQPEQPARRPAHDLTAYTCAEVAEKMELAIRELKELVHGQEFDLAYTTANGMLNKIWGRSPGARDREVLESYHIGPERGLEPNFVAAAQIHIDSRQMRVLGFQVVPSIAAFMLRGARYAAAADDSAAFLRPAGLGLSEFGAYPAWSTLLAEFEKVTTGSAAELVRAGELLAEAAGFFEDTDGSAAEELKGLKKYLDRGKFHWEAPKRGGRNPYAV